MGTMGRGACTALAALACVGSITCRPAPNSAPEPEVKVLEVPTGAAALSADFVVPADRDDTASAEPTPVIVDREQRELTLVWDLTVAPGGQVFVLDNGPNEVVAFAPDGAHLGALANPVLEGGGLRGPISVTIAGDRVVVNDAGLADLLFWNLDGSFAERVGMPAESSLEDIHGLADGTVVARFVLDVGDRIAVSRFDREAQEIARYGVFDPVPVDPASLLPRVLLAVAFQGRVYLAHSASYRIVAYEPDATGVWALDVEGVERQEITEELLGRALPEEFAGQSLERTRRAGRAAGANVREDAGELEYPEHAPALGNMQVDGRGRLWVFPWVEGPDQDGMFPVDVYDRAGRRLFAGRVPIDSWAAARGDDVYRPERIAGGNGYRIVRYRLSLPDGSVSPTPDGY